MDFALPDGYTLIKTDELVRIKNLASKYQQFKQTYYRYNKQLNRLLNETDRVLNPLKEEK